MAESSWSFAGTEPAPLLGSLRIPGDKSVSHRAVMLGSIAQGTTEIHGFLPAADTLATLRIFEQLGVNVVRGETDQLLVQGVGLHGLKPPTGPLDCGNAGTAMRLLAGLLAGQSFDTSLVGDESLSVRPMQRIIDPLTRMGARIESESGLAPLHIVGGRVLSGIDIQPEQASAQVKSAILLAGLYASGPTTVRELRPTRDYTERMLLRMGCDVRIESDLIVLQPPQQLAAQVWDVPADFSSAAFWLVAASLIPGSDLVLLSVGISERRAGLLRVLRLMGANIEVLNTRDQGLDVVADLRVRAVKLHGIEVPIDCVPDMIDEFPILFVAAACASGVTTIRGAAELRHKESDRLQVMADGLSAMGVKVQTTDDGARIEGGLSLHAAAIASHGDHRIAMSLAMLNWARALPGTVLNVENVGTSYPEFAEQLLQRQAPLQISRA
ncbi:3-phosphoshikimate 1-carboxyvinyltransferase [Aquilutibacter rugosus]|uniref:3-phosphoshikimate 1-carboxyvinyltransferase n=1 Tax=Aquilutibacter rugosus TaxID=3115820 RepID=UPI002F423628